MQYQWHPQKLGLRLELRFQMCIAEGTWLPICYVSQPHAKNLNIVNTEKVVDKSSNQILRANTGLWMAWSRAWSNISYSHLIPMEGEIKNLFHIFFELWEFKIPIITLLFCRYIFIGISISEWINSAIVKNRFCSLFKDKHEQCQVNHFGNFPVEKARSWKLNVL